MLTLYVSLRQQNPLQLVGKRGTADHKSYTSQNIIYDCHATKRRSHEPRGVRRGSTPASLLGLWIRIRPVARMLVSCECCVLSGKGLCDGPITLPKESNRVWGV
jgi:hypothetical protein